ncbi:MAG TPA: response regulator [Burkholderiaceae bacterium]|nr:response regulator [Burkholderiaceae bacterium]
MTAIVVARKVHHLPRRFQASGHEQGLVAHSGPVSPPSPQDKGSSAGDAGTIERRRVLVVDDNHDAADTLALLLELMGHEVRTAHDGLRALDVAEEFRPHVVLLDIGLPQLNGYEVARRLRQQSWSRTTLLVAVTGWGQAEDQLRSTEAGFDRHLVKPVDEAMLIRVLSETR